MSYGSGRFPLERASKLGHVKLVEHEQVTRLIRQFERIDTEADEPVGALTGIRMRCDAISASRSSKCVRCLFAEKTSRISARIQ